MNVLHCILFPDIQIMRKLKIVSHVDITFFEGKTLQKTKENLGKNWAKLGQSK